VTLTETAVLRWRGVNHLALVTPDMDATVRFYHAVLGMRLVATLASWWVSDATGRDADYRDRRFFADRDPVPAVREIAGRGEVASVPATRLVGDEVSDPV
jgi:catechol 2,3-dioxygenase-like lactoylglutathione lyase family enzyme